MELVKESDIKEMEDIMYGCAEDGFAFDKMFYNKYLTDVYELLDTIARRSYKMGLEQNDI